MNPQTDIVLPVHDALEYAQRCVEGLFAVTKNFRLIIVDDFSTPETASHLYSYLLKQHSALMITTAQQKWFTRASNLGLRLVRTERAVLLNSDCEMGEGWLEELYDVWDDARKQFTKVGMVGSHQSAEEPRRWEAMTEPGYVTGHAVLYSMEALAEIASKRGQPGWYLDEVHQDAIHINSDRYASYEMNRLGYATIRSFKSNVGHHGGKSWGYNLGRTAGLRLGDPLKGDVFG